MTAAEKLRVSYADYLVAEATAVERHEYIRGEVFAMSGGTPEHSLLSLAAGRELSNALRGKPCLVFESNMRLRNADADFSCYPDASVVCGAIGHAPDDALAISNPVLVIEVLSDSTEAYDRGTKSSQYRAFSSVKEIVLISQKTQQIEIQRRNAQGLFVVHEFGPGSTVEFDSVGVRVSMTDLYRDLVEYRRLASLP
jgi:Uma2 family endonuclease